MIQSSKIVNVFAGTQTARAPSLAAVALSDLIDSAMLIYGVPASAVHQISGIQHAFQHASFFGRKLHAEADDAATVMLIGDAAMQVTSALPVCMIQSALALASNALPVFILFQKALANPLEYVQADLITVSACKFLYRVYATVFCYRFDSTCMPGHSAAKCICSP